MHEVKFDPFLGILYDFVWGLLCAILLLIKGCFNAVSILTGTDTFRNIIEKNPISAVIIGIAFGIFVLTASVLIIKSMAESNTGNKVRTILQRVFLFVGVIILVPSVMLTLSLVVDTIAVALTGNKQLDVAQIIAETGWKDGKIPNGWIWYDTTPNWDNYNPFIPLIAAIPLLIIICLIGFDLVKRLMVLVWQLIISPFVFGGSLSEEQNYRISSWKDTTMSYMLMGASTIILIKIYGLLISQLQFIYVNNPITGQALTLLFVVGGALATYQLNHFLFSYFQSTSGGSGHSQQVSQTAGTTAKNAIMRIAMKGKKPPGI